MQLGDATTTYGYDALGNLTRSTDALGASTYSYYDALGRVLAVVAPARSVLTGISTTGAGSTSASTTTSATLIPITEFRRDAHGNVLVRIDRAGSVGAAVNLEDTSASGAAAIMAVWPPAARTASRSRATTATAMRCRPKTPWARSATAPTTQPGCWPNSGTRSATTSATASSSTAPASKPLSTTSWASSSTIGPDSPVLTQGLRCQSSLVLIPAPTPRPAVGGLTNTAGKAVKVQLVYVSPTRPAVYTRQQSMVETLKQKPLPPITTIPGQDLHPPAPPTPPRTRRWGVFAWDDTNLVVSKINPDAPLPTGIATASPSGSKTPMANGCSYTTAPPFQSSSVRTVAASVTGTVSLDQRYNAFGEVVARARAPTKAASGKRRLTTTALGGCGATKAPRAPRA